MSLMEDKQKTELAEQDNQEAIKEKVDEQFSSMLSAFWDPNMMQLRLEQWGWGNQIMMDTMKAAIQSYHDVLTKDADEVADNPDQYIKWKQLQIWAGKKFMQFLWGKDTKDPVSVAEVTPLMWRSEKG